MGWMGMPRKGNAKSGLPPVPGMGLPPLPTKSREERRAELTPEIRARIAEYDTPPGYDPEPVVQPIKVYPVASPIERIRRIKHRAKELHRRITRRGELEGEIFIQNGIDLFNFKRYGLWAHVQGDGENKEAMTYASFDAYLADPDNHLTASTAHLGVQVVTLFLYLLWFSWKDMRDIGQKKLMLIAPYLGGKLLDRLYVIRSEDGELVEYPLRDLDPVRWKRYRGIAEYWVARAKVLSSTDLAVELGRHRGWDTFFHGSITVGKLRSFKKVSDLLAYFGVDQLPDNETVYPVWKRKLQHRKAE